MRERRLQPGEALFRQGDPADGLFVLTQGSISIVGRNGASSQRFLSMSPGMMVGEAAMIDGQGRSADAVADMPCVVHHLDQATLTAIEREQPALALQLRHEGRALALLSLHTLPPVSRANAATRDEQLRAAADWSTEQVEAGRAPVLLGDLNATPFSAGVRPLRTVGLRDSLAPGGLLAAGSWPALPGPLRIAIDHCWHDAGLVTVRRVVGPALGSDHRPLEVALAWAAAP